MMCVCLALDGSWLSSGIGRRPVCVDVMISAFGILTWTPGFAGTTLLVVSCGVLKCAVAPLSRTNVVGEDNKGKSLFML